ncbi:Paraquat-inducible protein A [Microbulbifer aggregans]|uniref:Paraquat-inducible protein A n=1 Tax=Microbulbifer aggregans TaxID=1769779 RepID=A0A1C9W456_9GAMM|nr:paraquat-inducible protein A [Microbulbifer aggregans]AOS95910.1 Paraquat-inducible protein A [Microbulbifer aggregans]
MSRLDTALAHRLCTCLCCHQLMRLPAGESRGRCGRCGATVHGRIERSLMLTWALVLTGTFLLVPANILPVMTVIYLGSGEPSTIIGGTLELYRNGLWGIALIVFIASIAVPVMKLVGLVVLLLQVQWRAPRNPMQSMRVYRVVAAIGRWSLLDLFMISILVALVNMGAIAEVRAGPGSTAFATVVVVTMLAVRTFDPRLLWDARQCRAAVSAARESADGEGSDG